MMQPVKQGSEEPKLEEVHILFRYGNPFDVDCIFGRKTHGWANRWDWQC